MSSTADTNDEIEVSTDAIIVRKRFDDEEFPVPVIAFEIETEHDEAVAFRLSEDIPDSFSMERVGFHPDYHGDDWTAFRDHRVEFTGTVDQDEVLVTVYGIRIDDDTDIEAFLSEPTIVEAAPVSTDASSEQTDEVVEGILSNDRNQVVKDMLVGDEALPGLESEESANDSSEGDDEHDSETVDASESAGEKAASHATDGADSQTDDSDSDDAETDDELDSSEAVTEADDEAVAEVTLSVEPDAESQDIDLGYNEPDDSKAEDVEDSSESDEVVETGADDVDDADEVVESADPVEADTMEDEARDESTIEESGDDGSPLELEMDDKATPTAEGDGETERANEGRAEDESTLENGVTVDGVSEADPGSETTAEDGADVESVHESDAADRDDTTAAISNETPLGEQLSREIETGRIDDADLDVIRSALGGGLSTADRTRIDHLQSRVETVAAYTDALEEFLDDNGSGSQLIEDVKDSLETVESELNDLGDELTSTESRIDDVEDTVDDLDQRSESLSDDIDTVDERTDELADEYEDLDERVEHVDTTVDDLESSLESVADDVTDLVSWRDQLGSMFSS